MLLKDQIEIMLLIFNGEKMENLLVPLGKINNTEFWILDRILSFINTLLTKVVNLVNFPGWETTTTTLPPDLPKPNKEENLNFGT